MKINPRKVKSILVSRPRTYAPDYGELTIDGEEREEVRSLRILGITIDSKLTFQTPLREFVSKAVRSVGIVCRT